LTSALTCQPGPANVAVAPAGRHRPPRALRDIFTFPFGAAACWLLAAVSICPAQPTV